MLQFIPLQNASLFVPFELEESNVLQLIPICPILKLYNTWNKINPSFTEQYFWSWGPLFLLLSLYDSYNLSPYRVDICCFYLPNIPSAFSNLDNCLLALGISFHRASTPWPLLLLTELKRPCPAAQVNNYPLRLHNLHRVSHFYRIGNNNGNKLCNNVPCARHDFICHLITLRWEIIIPTWQVRKLNHREVKELV